MDCCLVEPDEDFQSRKHPRPSPAARVLQARVQPRTWSWKGCKACVQPFCPNLPFPGAKNLPLGLARCSAPCTSTVHCLPVPWLLGFRVLQDMVTGRASGSAALVTLLHWKATSKSYQLTCLGRDHLPPPTSSGPWKRSCLPPVGADTAPWRLPICIPKQASWPPGSSLCFAYQSPSFPKGSAFEGFSLLAVILSPTPKPSNRCHSTACAQHPLSILHPPAPSAAPDRHPATPCFAPGVFGAGGGGAEGCCTATNPSPTGQVLSSCGCPTLAASHGCRGPSQRSVETFGFDFASPPGKQRRGRLLQRLSRAVRPPARAEQERRKRGSAGAHGEGQGCGRGCSPPEAAGTPKPASGCCCGLHGGKRAAALPPPHAFR